MREMGGVRAGLRDGRAEGIVGILCHDCALFVDVSCDISVVVVAWEIVGAVDADCQQAADSARALQRAGEVVAPVVLLGGRLEWWNGGIMDFHYQAPTVIDEGRGVARRPLRHTAAHVVVCV